MSTIQLKNQIHGYIDKLQDENFVQAIHAMLSAYISNQKDNMVSYDVNGKAQYAEEMKKQYKEGIQAVQRGEGKTIAEMKVKFNNV